MSVQLLSPFTQVFRRSAPKGSGDLLTGRWAIVDASGQAVVPGGGQAGKPGAYLVLEGNLGHKGTGADFSTATSTKSFTLPSVVQSGEIALAYGVFRYEVGPEGFDNSDVLGTPASYDVGDLLTTDQYGRLVPAAGGNELVKIEAIAVDANGVTKATLRTLGK